MPKLREEMLLGGGGGGGRGAFLSLHEGKLMIWMSLTVPGSLYKSECLWVGVLESLRRGLNADGVMTLTVNV